MSIKEKIILWASAVIGLLSLLVLASERVPGYSDACYYSYKGVALFFFILSFIGIKSVEHKIPDE